MPKPRLDTKYRSDVDGLRAIAVLSVVVFHAFPNWLKGGFIGVDVFFVISGYLISTIIFKELHESTFNLIEFYSKRIRRIFPALILVLIASITFGWFALLASEFQQLSKHVAAGAGFVSNLVFWHESGYFDNAAVTKPLLHLWSLAVEEQFYLIWPFLLLFAWKKKLNILSITIIATFLSFLLNVRGIKVDVAGAFYSPQTRLWELLSGSLLAWFTLYHQNILSSLLNKLENKKRRILANLLSLVGLLLLFYGFWRISEIIAYPGVWALIPVFGTLLIISAGSKAWANRTILSNKVAVFFGLISYPLYLWHWPILTFARIVEGTVPSRNIRLGAIFLAVILAWLTYQFIERPIRYGKYLPAKTIVLFSLMVLVGLGSYVAYRKNIVSYAANKVEFLSRQIGWTIPVSSPEQINWCNKMFPDRILLTPRERNDNFCMIKTDSPPNVVIVGDSLSLNLFPGLNQYDDINALVLSASAAAPLYNIRTTEVNDSIRLNNYKLTNQALDYALNNDKINVVILTFMSGPLLTDPNYQFEIVNILNPHEKDPRLIFTQALSLTVSKLLSKNKQVIYVLPNPRLSYDITSCLNSYRPFRLTRGVEKPCAESSSYYLEHGGRIYREWVTSVLKNFPEVKVFDAADPLCDQNVCWGMKDGKVLYRDVAHLSISGSELISPPLASLIRQALKSDINSR